VLDCILSGTFAGRDVVRRQLRESEVRTADEDGSLEFRLASDEPAPVTDVVAAEAVWREEGRSTIHALLFVNAQGLVYLLEFFTEDGSRVGSLPETGWTRI
jgi:hypothetical protein